MSNDLANKLEEVVWSRVIENIRDLGQVLMRPEDYTDTITEKRLDRASCTVAWVSLLKDKDLVISDLMPDAHDLITYLYDIIKDKRYEDGQSLIRAAELDKIVRPDPSIKFPEDLIPVFEVILRTYFKTRYLIG